MHDHESMSPELRHSIFLDIFKGEGDFFYLHVKRKGVAESIISYWDCQEDWWTLDFYLWRSCIEVISISVPLMSRKLSEVWKSWMLSAGLKGDNLFSRSVSVCRKLNSWNMWCGKSVRLLDPKSSSCRLFSRPAKAPSDRLVRPQPWIDSSRIPVLENASA